MRVASRARGFPEKLLEPEEAVLFCWGSNVKGSSSSLSELGKFFLIIIFWEILITYCGGPVLNLNFDKLLI